MKYLSILLIYTVFACNISNNTTSKKLEKEKWISLFNGENMEGWTPKIVGYPAGENFANTFRVENGVLKNTYDQYEGEFEGRFGHLFYKEPFSSYRLRVEYRFVGEQYPNGPGWAFRNNGLMLHCQSPESMLLDQDFPVSIEAQILGGDGTSERSTGNLCTPGTNVVMNEKLITDHCISSNSKTYHNDQWVMAEFVVLEDRVIHHIIEGDTVLTYYNLQIGGGGVPEGFPMKVGEKLEKGYISIQSETHPTEFRKIELLNLEN